ETVRHAGERFVPARTMHRARRIAQHRIEQPSFKPERLAERRALGAKLAEIRRMPGIARDFNTVLSRARDNPAAYPAIGTSGADLRGRVNARVHGSIHVSLIAAALLQLGDEGDRLVGGARAEFGDDVDQRALHVLRHALRVAADIEMRA